MLKRRSSLDESKEALGTPTTATTTNGRPSSGKHASRGWSSEGASAEAGHRRDKAWYRREKEFIIDFLTDPRSLLLSSPVPERGGGNRASRIVAGSKLVALMKLTPQGTGRAAVAVLEELNAMGRQFADFGSLVEYVSGHPEMWGHACDELELRAAQEAEEAEEEGGSSETNDSLHYSPAVALVGGGRRGGEGVQEEESGGGGRGGRRGGRPEHLMRKLQLCVAG